MFSFRSINSTNQITTPQQQMQQLQQQSNQFRNNVAFPLFLNRFTIQKPKVAQTVVPEVKVYPKLKWGEPIWNLFHTMAEKIIPENFFGLRTEIFDIIRNVCYNLPCPDCSTHARNYINGINFNAITTPNNLKEMLFNFHNMVNKRKHFPEYNRDELDARYKNMNMISVITVFLQHFRDKHKSTRMLADDLYTGRLANKIEKWFMQYIGNFAT